MIIVVDVECYSNWFGVCALDEFDRSYEFDVSQIESLFELIDGNTVVTFNGANYDIPLLLRARDLMGCVMTIPSVHRLLHADSRRMAKTGKGLSETERWLWQVDHIDLRPLCPPRSLTLLAARMNSDRLMLPPGNDRTLSNFADCFRQARNNCKITKDLYVWLGSDIALRESLNRQYKGDTDFRSLSNAQIGERIMTIETGMALKPGAPPDRTRYEKPDCIDLVLHECRELADEFCSAEFEIDDSTGHYVVPESLSGRTLAIGDTDYAVGLGGLHSTEKGLATETSFLVPNEQLFEVDVSSYYPTIIDTLKLSPSHYPKAGFNLSYSSLLARRLEAKRIGNHTDSEALKIAVNGVFGKFASKYSALYDPSVMLQVTLTGQLMLLMLIESLELNGCQVVSANTDGVFMLAHSKNKHLVNKALGEWRKKTGCVLDSKRWSARYARDVNNYVLIGLPVDRKLDDVEAKGKGVWNMEGSLFRNPFARVCVFAASRFLQDIGDTGCWPIERLVENHASFWNYLCVRSVKDGAVWKGKDVGSVVRWYYGTDGEPVYSKARSSKVARSEGAQVCLALPDGKPKDIDMNWYVKEAKALLHTSGYVGGEFELEA